MKVTMIVDVSHAGEAFAAGEVAEVDPVLAERWVRRGQAELADESAEATHEAATASPPAESGEEGESDTGDEAEAATEAATEAEPEPAPEPERAGRRRR